MYNSWQRYAKLLLWGLGLTLWCLGITCVGVAPASAQQTLVVRQAPVVIDGRTLFYVRDSGGLRASIRAERINNELTRSIADLTAGRLSYLDFTVDTQPDSPLPTIQLNGNHLLTVTSADALTSQPLITQANIWRQDLQRAADLALLERTPAYTSQASLYSLVAFAVVCLGYLALGTLRRQLTRSLHRSVSHTAPHLEKPIRLFIQVIALGLQTGLWLGVIYYISDLFPTTRILRHAIHQALWVGLTSPFITLGTKGYSSLDLMILVGSFVGLWILSRAVAGLIKSRVLALTGADHRMRELVAVLTQYLLLFLGLIVILQVWGLDVSSLTILASVLGVGIGFGLQNTANNFISGLIITFERPIQVGDFIHVGDLQGIVERIGTRTTEIRTLDKVSIIVPNSRFVDNQVVNWSLGNPVSRLHIPVGLAYGSEVEKVRIALLEAAREHPDVLTSPAPQVWMKGFGDSALNFELLVWICEPREQYRIRSDLNFRIMASLKRHNLEVPYPQHDVHLRAPRLETLLANTAGTTPTSGVRLPDPQARPAAETSNGNQVASSVGHTEILLEPPPVLDRRSYLEGLAARMRGPSGLDIKDRWHLLQRYPCCFTGTAAVDWLTQMEHLDRRAAVRLGQEMLTAGLFHHVLDEQDFEDDDLFYRFYADEEAGDTASTALT
ncbi:MAG: mechanosensitive ion channel [Gloeomargaritaceae cyanobacterium C42_A2020_066]|nr:mechanosensitive ion channel [Gloeomargaritaceae cyanobacterium C42_A2020_066]